MRVEFELSLSRAYHHKDHNLLGFVITLSLLTCLPQTSHPENFNNLVNRYKEYFVLDWILIRLMKGLIKSFNP